MVYLLGLVFYQGINVITDIRERKTRWYLHIIFLLLGLLFTYIFDRYDHFLVPVLIVLVSFSMGRLLEVLHAFSAGDTKMLIVNALWLNLIIPGLNHFIIVTFLLVIHFAIMVLYTFFVQVRKEGFVASFLDNCRTFKKIILRIPRKKEMIVTNFPGAVSIAIAAVVFLYFWGNVV